jgi:tetratricopeptide (TPR) repeat protein
VTVELDRLRTALRSRYAIEREVGHGGMATVYLAEDLKHGRPVAIKVLRPELTATLAAERFLHEIQIAARLAHPHILPVFDSGEANGLLYYVMPFVEGESLRERLEREARIPLEEAVRIVREVADALDYAHGEGVIHRDIKPANILFEAGQGVVADFGVARAVSEAGSAHLTQAGVAVGTPAYMSPEQASLDVELDGRSDQYSLACVLYEMLAGRPPFTDKTPMAVLASHVQQPVPALPIRGPGVSEAVEEAIGRALSKRPVERYATVREFGDALNDSLPSAMGRRARTVPGTLVTYAAGGWLLLQLIDGLASRYLLPDWVHLSALVLVLAGFPLFLATALMQKGMPSLFRSREAAPGQALPYRLFTWRKVLLGSMGAFTVLGILTAGFLASRALGVGPGATLLAQGVLQERDRILLADFENETDDPRLGDVVTEALRVDLTQSETVDLAEPAFVHAALARMEREADVTFGGRLALEMASREGIKAVLTGAIASAGDGFQLVADLLSGSDGVVLVTHRETASDASGVLTAIDKLSKRMRERIGEPLRAIRASEPLEQVTTRNLEALKLYSEAVRAADTDMNADRALGLLEEAVALDTAFAAAHRKIGRVLLNMGEDRERSFRALENAFNHRDRLPRRERLLAAGTYYSAIGEDERARQAYERLVELAPDNSGALNNLAVEYLKLRDWTKAGAFLRRAIEADSFNAIPYGSLFRVQVGGRELAEARRTAEAYVARFPESHSRGVFQLMLTTLEGDYEAALTLAQVERDRWSGDPFASAQWAVAVGAVQAIRGQFDEAFRSFDQALESHARRGADESSLFVAAFAAAVDGVARGDTASALSRIERALERFPLSTLPASDRPYVDVADVYAAVGEPETAKWLLSEFEQAVPVGLRRADDARLFRIRAAIARAERRYPMAIELIRRSDEGPCTICPLYPAGETYDGAGIADSAIAYYEAYLEEPDITRFYDDARLRGPTLERLGQLCDETGDLENALKYYAMFVELWAEADLEVQPRVQAAQRRLEEILAERG